MVEIRSARPRSGAWPWLVGLVVLALLSWVATDAMVDRLPQTPAGERSTQGASEEEPLEPAPPPWPVATIAVPVAAAA